MSIWQVDYNGEFEKLSRSGAGIGEGLGFASDLRSGTGGALLFGAVTGGLGAAIGGGNFWQGAATGLAVTAFNHMMHKMNIDPPGRKTGLNEQKPDPSDMDAKYNIPKGTKWTKPNGFKRFTIFTKKEILQWSGEGEVEVYTNSNKPVHKGGFNPFNRNIQSGKAVNNRNPQIINNNSLKFKNLLNIRGFINDIIFGGPLMQMELNFYKGSYQPSGS